MARAWTDEEVEFLKENIDSMTYQQLANELKRTKNAVVGKCHRDGIKKDKYKYIRYGEKFNAKRWTEEEDEFLIKNNKTMTDKEIANHLGRTLSSIVNRKRLLRTRCKKTHRTNRNIKIISCPNCHTKRFVGQTGAYHYYCRNCLTEFDANGKILEPIWEDESI